MIVGSGLEGQLAVHCDDCYRTPVRVPSLHDVVQVCRHHHHPYLILRHHAEKLSVFLFQSVSVSSMQYMCVIDIDICRHMQEIARILDAPR